MELIKLSSRLAAIARLIPQGTSVVDVGTDHGYIPVYLAQLGIYGAIAASDVNVGPLENARKSARDHAVLEQIRFEQCSGLSFPGSEQFQTIIIAGMGGELIVSILKAAAWTKQQRTLILQPNSKIDVLNRWLSENGYCVTQARLVKDSGKLYQILVASGGSMGEIFTPCQLLVHPQYFQNKDPLLPEYLDGLIHKYASALAGMRQGRPETCHIEELELLIKDLQLMRKETESWQQ